jgi:hypothetical protein
VAGTLPHDPTCFTQGFLVSIRRRQNATSFSAQTRADLRRAAVRVVRHDGREQRARGGAG